MKHLRFFQLLPVLTAGLLLAAPATSMADRKVTVYRDRDGDGHYNKKSYKVDSGRYYRGGDRYYGRSYGSYGRSYGYNSRPYAYPYYRPYYYSSGPTVSLNFSRSAYSAPRTGYYADDLAVDVQRELRRRGYYRGPVDGDVGPGTRAAIRAYQDDRGLGVTGRIDRSLIRSLGVG